MGRLGGDGGNSSEIHLKNWVGNLVHSASMEKIVEKELNDLS